MGVCNLSFSFQGIGESLEWEVLMGVCNQSFSFIPKPQWTRMYIPSTCGVLDKDKNNIDGSKIFSYTESTCIQNCETKQTILDCGRWRSDFLCNFSIMACQWTVNCLLFCLQYPFSNVLATKKVGKWFGTSNQRICPIHWKMKNTGVWPK